MPELPEVRRVVSSLKRLHGSQLRHVELRRADVLRVPENASIELLLGATLTRIRARGKQIWLEFDRPWHVLAHLGMTGEFRLVPPGTEPLAHTHIVLQLDLPDRPSPQPKKAQALAVHVEPVGRQAELHFVDPRRFGGWWLLPKHQTGVSAGRGQAVGLDAYLIRQAQFRQVLIGTRRQLKPLLLDQRHLAGLGNIYVDEALFDAGLHPLRRSDTLSDADRDRLYASIKRVLKRAVRAGGSTIRSYRDASGQPGQFQRQHRVYGRGGEPCLRCGTTIDVLQVAGRTTCLCPGCQPGTP